MENEKKLDAWDDFVSGTFLKPINVNSEQEAFVVLKVDIIDMEDRQVPRLSLERNGKEFDFDLNKTNAVFLKNAGIASPKAMLGKKIFFRKALVRNPRTNMEQEGLRIFKVE